MSTLWTPYGEHQPGAGPGAGPTPEAASEAATDAETGEIDPELAEELAQARAQLAATAVSDIVANHAVGLWQLAIVHLAPEGEEPPRLEEARLAIDAMAALVEGLGDRLAEHAAPLRDALGQLRLVYVKASRAPGTPE